MKTATIYRSIIILLISFAQMDCKQESVLSSQEIKLGSRDYVWTVDTLQSRPGDSFVPTQIWGSAPDNIWVTGFGSSSVSLLYHYDGASWNRDSVPRIIAPSALWGTANNNIWLGNTNNTIWRYDGAQWSTYGTYVLPGYSSNRILNFFGTSSSDVYAVGNALSDTNNVGIMMHFDGLQWQFVQLQQLKCQFTEMYQQTQTGLLFIGGTSDTAYNIFVYDKKNISLIHSNSVSGSHVYEIKGEIYIAIGQKIYKYHNSQLQLWKDLSNTSFVGVVNGRTETDFFTYTTNDFITWGIGHYNGIDLQTIYNFPLGYRISGMMIFDNDIFCQGYGSSSNTNIVIHGKLKRSYSHIGRN